MIRWTLLASCIALLLGTTSTVPVYSHGGGLDANGGHHDRKAGTYHYHRRKSTPSNTSSAFTPTPIVTPKPAPKKEVTPQKPKGRIWSGRDGERLAKGVPTEFNEASCTITINDGVHSDQNISLTSLSVLDQAFTLDGFKKHSAYNSQLLKWTSKGGSHHIFATPLVVDDESVRLLKSDGRIIDVNLARLDELSRHLARELQRVGLSAKAMIDAIEPNPFEGGTPTDSEGFSSSDLSTTATVQ